MALTLILLFVFSFFLVFEHEQSHQINAVQEVMDSEKKVDSISFDTSKDKAVTIHVLSLVCMILILSIQFNLSITFKLRPLVLNPKFYQSNYLDNLLLNKRV